jgi:hypothetical protein
VPERHTCQKTKPVLFKGNPQQTFQVYEAYTLKEKKEVAFNS